MKWFFGTDRPRPQDEEGMKSGLGFRGDFTCPMALAKAEKRAASPRSFLSPVESRRFTVSSAWLEISLLNVLSREN